MVAESRRKTRSQGPKSQEESIPGGETSLSKDPPARQSLAHLRNYRNRAWPVLRSRRERSTRYRPARVGRDLSSPQQSELDPNVLGSHGET